MSLVKVKKAIAKRFSLKKKSIKNKSMRKKTKMPTKWKINRMTK